MKKTLTLLGMLTGCTILPLVKEKDALEDVVRGYDNSTSRVSDESIKKELACTYMAEVSQGHGSCVAFAKDLYGTYFLTAAHVMGDEKFAMISNGDVNGMGVNTSVAATVRMIDGKNDVAVLFAESLAFNTYEVYARNLLESGDAVHATGFPSVLGKMVTGGLINRVDDRYFLSDAVLNPGNSGGPIFVFEDGVPALAGLGEFMARGTYGLYGFIPFSKVLESLTSAGLEHLLGEF